MAEQKTIKPTTENSDKERLDAALISVMNALEKGNRSGAYSLKEATDAMIGFSTLQELATKGISNPKK